MSQEVNFDLQQCLAAERMLNTVRFGQANPQPPLPNNAVAEDWNGWGYDSNQNWGYETKGGKGKGKGKGKGSKGGYQWYQTYNNTQICWLCKSPQHMAYDCDLLSNLTEKMKKVDELEKEFQSVKRETEQTQVQQALHQSKKPDNSGEYQTMVETLEITVSTLASDVATLNRTVTKLAAAFTNLKKDVTLIGADLKKISKSHADRMDLIAINASKAISESKRVEAKFQRDVTLIKNAVNKGTKVGRFLPIEKDQVIDINSTEGDDTGKEKNQTNKTPKPSSAKKKPTKGRSPTPIPTASRASDRLAGREASSPEDMAELALPQRPKRRRSSRVEEDEEEHVPSTQEAEDAVMSAIEPIDE
jgi:uncharacterized coiled-coil protein SlyX